MWTPLSNLTSRLFRRARSVAFDNSFKIDIPFISYGWNLSNCSVVADSVDRVAAAIANTDPICKEGNSVVQSRALTLINQPNAKQTGDDMIYKITEDLYKGGRAYVVLIGNPNSPPSEIQFIEGGKVSRQLDQNGELVRVLITNSDYGGTYRYDDKERLIDAETGLKQLVIVAHPTEASLLQPAALEIAVLTDGLKRNAGLMQNGGRLSTLVTFKDLPGQAEFQSRLETIDAQIRRKMYGGILATNGETDLKEMGLTPRDMDFTALQSQCEERIYLQCGVPLPLVRAAAATYNNYELAQETFYVDTVISLANLIYSTIGQAIAVREHRQYTTLTDVQKIPIIQKMLMKAVKERADLGADTVNEIRELLGQEPYQGGDVLLVKSNMVPLEALGVER